MEKDFITKMLEKRDKELESLIKEMERAAKNLNFVNEENSKVEEKFLKEVTEFGNSSHISLPRKFLGRKAEVRILKEEKEEDQK